MQVVSLDLGQQVWGARKFLVSSQEELKDRQSRLKQCQVY
jgi:hypothetical protein